MFKKAIEKTTNYVRPLVIGKKEKSEVNSYIQSFIVINKDGWILTTAENVQEIIKANEINKKYFDFKKENVQIANEKKRNKELENYFLDNEVSYQKNVFIDAFQNGIIDKIIIHKFLNIALVKWRDFTETNIKKYPVLALNNSFVGDYVCKVGFTSNNSLFKENENHDELIYNQKNSTFSLFPLEGMITRYVADEENNISMFEVSSPGINGHKGSAVVNSEGELIGMHITNVSIDMGDNNKVNLGIAINVEAIKGFLKDNKVSFKTVK